MRWFERQIREGMNGRTYGLLGVLLLVLLWIHVLDEQTRTFRARAAASGGPATPAAAFAAGTGSERAEPAAPTPPGWGDDPFHRRVSAGG